MNLKSKLKNALMFFLMVVAAFNLCYAQESPPWEYRSTVFIPKAPQTAEMKNFLDSQINHSKGIPQISILLHQLELVDFTLPIEISYDASGIKVQDISSAIGLKWSLSAGGSISRNISGLPDEFYPWGFLYLNPNYTSSVCEPSSLLEYYEGRLDIMPDFFNLICTGASSEFILDSNQTVYKTIKDGSIITYQLNGNDLTTFTVKDVDGNEYIFGNGFYESTIKEIQTDVLINPGDLLNGSGRTGWMLHSIVTPINDTIAFDYYSYSYTTELQNSIESCSYTSRQCDGSISTSGTLGRKTELIRYTTQLIKSIRSNTEDITFNYSNNSNLSLYKMRLDSIQVIDRISGIPVKKVIFGHETYYGDQRLKLNSVAIASYSSNAQNEVYAFNYNQGALVDYSSTKKDIFGYQNTNNVAHLIPVQVGYEGNFNVPGGPADRSVNETTIKHGVLSEIIFPTKGRKKFEYEPNVITENNQTIIAPGLRVKEITVFDQDNSLLQSTKYSYSGLTGPSVRQENYSTHFRLRSQGEFNAAENSYYWSAEPLPLNLYSFGLRTGFYYKMVKEELYDNNIANGARVYVYDEFEAGNSIKTRLIEEVLLRNQSYSINDTVEKTVYNYESLYDSDKIHAFVLGDVYSVSGALTICGQMYSLTGCNTMTYYPMLNSLLHHMELGSFLTEKVTKSFPVSNNSVDSGYIRTVERYSYNTKQMRVGTYLFSTIASNVEKFETGSLVFYAADFADETIQANNFLLAMNSKNIQSRPIYSFTLSQIDGSTLINNGHILTYTNNGQLYEVYQMSLAEPLHFERAPINLIIDGFERKAQYSYTSFNRLSQIETEKELRSYFWSHNKSRIIGQFNDLSYNDLYNNYSLMVALNEFKSIREVHDIQTRNLIINKAQSILAMLPNKVYATLYTHEWAGVSGIIDINGIGTFFQYDPMGRLKTIRDHDFNITKEIKYNYASPN